ncbi:MAG: ATP-binding protein, partial [Campylobacterota bacterium]|nr:ATP-binding protein [Campylobacterota bacterium]
EHSINNKDIKIEYKLLPDDKFMLVLTDITNTKKLENKIKEQNQIQKMIVSVASNKNDFIKLRFEFENFIANPSSEIKTLLRQLHTFKGIFAQKEMVNIVYAIHELETIINNAIINSNSNITEIIEILNKYNLEQYFQIDLKLIEEALGKEFLDMVCSLNIDIDSLDNLESKVKQLESKETYKIVEDILHDFEKIKHETVFHMLNTYPISIQQIAQKLDKDIYPLEIVGDEKIKVSSKFKPFIKTLIHLFNNCVEHGIEDMESRVENDKDEIGTIECKYEIIDNDLKIIISDDGAGINIDKLSQSAIKNNIKNSDELSSMRDDEKLFLVFEDNLSTNENISTTAGRGVGMSAIKNEVEKLNGNIEIKNYTSKGVEFIFTLPLEMQKEIKR